MKRLISGTAESKGEASYVDCVQVLKTNSSLPDKVSLSLFRANLDGL